MAATAGLDSIIRSAEEFLAQLKKGDTFYYMSTRRYKPYTVEGPFTIVALFKKSGYKGAQEFLNVRCRSGKGLIPKIEDYSVNDLTNPHHGVFTDKDEAWRYFKERKKHFEKNPDLAEALENETRGY